MGSIVVAEHFDDTKHRYKYSEGNDFEVDEEEVVLWVGNDFSPQHFISQVVVRGLDAELFATPGDGNVSKAVLTYPDSVSLTPDAAFVMPTEAQIAVFWGAEAQLTPGQDLSRQVRDLRATWLEQRGPYRARRAVA